ncbi:beta-L-arabinofuranosidase domain-containing protein [Sinomicrobium weinanense]|uniref:Glycoside hydrolase family 127 protein n=1 Tax=Sinomicrobium weinanense TaxID=2842200 RepID=A0A926Q1G7_9FLAO|nr:beta-L-arabinofuranosidase domain-containing protein [Sinomicrobium weinanense]MBC9795742.1 glycoside hydrolase family 127 protein [Sinomicrobium weinanense]MBU3125305.1 glycoside hydrolase family 127 protein [Sinomicrobium weinanense]
MRKKLKIAALIGLMVGVSLNTRAQEKSVYTYRLAGVGAIKPMGWIKNQMDRDLRQGLIGSFDKISNTVTYNLFVNQNRLNDRKYDNRKEWWSGEHEGYWKDAIIRMAYLTENRQYIDSAQAWVNEIINNTDTSGYIGIYKKGDTPHTRYNFTGPNGELWTQSRIMVALAAYYEFTGDKRVLDHLKKAVQLTMEKYRKKNPFATGTDGGTGHGVGYFEILEWLYRTTENKAYAEFAKKLYADLDRADTNIEDLAPKRLEAKKPYFSNHGAHIAEGFMAPFWLKALYPAPEYEQYARNAMYKLNYATTPGGAMRADENVQERKGTGNEAYEYCGITELISPFNSMISFSGDMQLADRTERAVFNAAQGARFADLSAVSYLTKDNRIAIDPKKKLGRYTFDSNHYAASCCTLNSGRLMPYYVQGMWMDNADGSGVTAVMFGPSSYTTTVKGTEVTIEEQTAYPFEDNIDFVFTVGQPASFTFTFRKPFGVTDVDISGVEDAEIDTANNTISVTRAWKTGDKVRVQFNFDVKQTADVDPEGNRQYFIRRGPLLYALAFPFTKRKLKEHNTSGFYQWNVTCTDQNGWDYQWPENPSFELVRDKAKSDVAFPFDKPVLKIKTQLRDTNGNKMDMTLVPMGNTVLRRLTFPMAP